MRSVYEVSKELASYAPNGGATWQNVGMRQVPVRLLTELREAVEREQRVKVAWQASASTEYHGGWKFDTEPYTARRWKTYTEPVT